MHNQPILTDYVLSGLPETYETMIESPWRCLTLLPISRLNDCHLSGEKKPKLSRYHGISKT